MNNIPRQPTEPSTSEHELLVTLADEGRRREGRLADGAQRAIDAEPGDAARAILEEIRAEAHALKGAAAVVGQTRLFELARALEDLLIEAIAAGSLSQRRAVAVADAAHAFVEGADASADGASEPESVRDSIDNLAA
jgi:HPt (histidine-containing phosphotransfer) domain-containing protein